MQLVHVHILVRISAWRLFEHLLPTHASMHLLVSIRLRVLGGRLHLQTR
jgi:hypothetical protein